MELKGFEWKFTNVKQEKDGVQGTVQIGYGNSVQKCGLSIFNSGTIMITRTKSFTFKVVQDFAGKILIPIAKEILDGKQIELNTAEAQVECKQCKKLFAMENELRNHIDDEHGLMSLEEETESTTS